MSATANFRRFKTSICGIYPATVKSPDDIPNALLMAEQGDLRCFYGPFEYVNRSARLVIVGLTPGLYQWKQAIRECQRQIALGASDMDTLRLAKEIGGFSGPLRTNLTCILDTIAVNKLLGVPTCGNLFEADRHLLQTTSVLLHPFFWQGQNFNNQARISKSVFLQEFVYKYFVEQIREFEQQPLILPLGSHAQDVVDSLVGEAILDGNKVLSGVPHPSGSNSERIAYFIGAKPKEMLSIKTNAEAIDSARAKLISQVRALLV